MRLHKKILNVLLVAGLGITMVFSSCQREDELNHSSKKSLPTDARARVEEADGYIVFLKESAFNYSFDEARAVDALNSSAQQISSDFLSEYNISPDAIMYTYSAAGLGFSARISREVADKMASDPRVSVVTPNETVTLNLPEATEQQAAASTQIIPYGIRRVGYGNGTGKTVWVIDSGIDFWHPDLNVDVTRSRSFIEDEPSAHDLNGHGTHVAGTIAAKNNNFGVVGVAYNATVVAVKVLSRYGYGTWAGVIAGINYVGLRAAPGQVANMSLGGGVNLAVDAAVRNVASRKNIKFAIAAGNQGIYAMNRTPGRVGHANVYTISAMNRYDYFAWFSNFGNPPIDFCAPGVNVYSTYKGGGYTTMSGTSMAAPHVAGILCLGPVKTSGRVMGDPDWFADWIAHR